MKIQLWHVLLIVVKSRDLHLIYFRVLHFMVSGHHVQHHNLSSGQHNPHPARHASPGNVKLQSVGIT